MAAKSEVPKGENEGIKKVTALFESVNPALDNVTKEVQAHLDDLRKEFIESKGTEGQKIEIFAASLYQYILSGLRKDLDELGIHKEAQNEHILVLEAEWDKVNKGRIAKEILESGELGSIEAVARSLEAHPTIMAAMASPEKMSVLESKFRSWFAQNNLPGEPGEYFTKLLGFFGGAGVAGFFGKKVAEKKEDEKKKKDEEGVKEAQPEDADSKDKDKEILQENIAIYKNTLEKNKDTITVLGLIEAAENESDLFNDIDGEDMEAQNGAVIEFTATELKDFGSLTDITPPYVKDGLPEPGVLAFETEGGGKVEYYVAKSDDQIVVSKVGADKTFVVDNNLAGLKSGLEQVNQAV